MFNYSRYIKDIVFITNIESIANLNYIILIYYNIEYIINDIVKKSRRYINRYIEEYI